MSKPKLNRPPLVKGDVIWFDPSPINGGDTRAWSEEHGRGPFTVRGLLRTVDEFDGQNPLIEVSLSNGSKLKDFGGNRSWWMGYFIKDEFLSAVKHAKKEAHDNPLPAGRKRARQHHENG